MRRPPVGPVLEICGTDAGSKRPVVSSMEPKERYLSSEESHCAREIHRMGVVKFGAQGGQLTVSRQVAAYETPRYTMRMLLVVLLLMMVGMMMMLRMMMMMMMEAGKGPSQ
eukprot:9409714-Pyramimonas_sp.AAC.1